MHASVNSIKHHSLLQRIYRRLCFTALETLPATVASHGRGQERMRESCDQMPAYEQTRNDRQPGENCGYGHPERTSTSPKTGNTGLQRFHL
eukprot:s2354_g3.t1